MERSIPESGLRKKAAKESRPGHPHVQADVFRRKLKAWYSEHARELPWRGTTDPYHIWVSEIMLQQTRVAAVIEHYNEFLRRFPTLVSLSLADESDVLAAWSGLGYYRRARMLHKAAQFIVTELQGKLPTTAAELRTLPGIGDYTAAAIASIAFGEPVAVVDGNVERVILRITGRANDSTAALRNFIREQAQRLMSHGNSRERNGARSHMEPKQRAAAGWDAAERLALAATAHPFEPAGGLDPGTLRASNAASEHNQAMMELGATICLPKAPLCLECPVYAECRTRGEHPTPARSRQRSVPIAYLLDTRKRGPVTEVLLERRADDASLMPGMYELPPLPPNVVEEREPVLRVRHSITNTNYYVQVFASRGNGTGARKSTALRNAIPKNTRDLYWVRISRLPSIPITGLTRKILHRLDVMQGPRISLLEE